MSTSPIPHTPKKTLFPGTTMLNLEPQVNFQPLHDKKNLKKQKSHHLSKIKLHISNLIREQCRIELRKSSQMELIDSTSIHQYPQRSHKKSYRYGDESPTRKRQALFMQNRSQNKNYHKIIDMLKPSNVVLNTRTSGSKPVLHNHEKRKKSNSELPTIEFKARVNRVKDYDLTNGTFEPWKLSDQYQVF